ncbi:hypothetical protein AAKU64_003309 [Undibacterium sp. GrIS 1.8]|uniref:hypothetical protein n=1 Tax=Undibacterium sp. GrIS 1.8 TaxID=3143934 RepID=UPI00339900FA
MHAGIEPISARVNNSIHYLPVYFNRPINHWTIGHILKKIEGVSAYLDTTPQPMGVDAQLTLKRSGL